MTPEYKFYHGAVLAELVDCCDFPLEIRALRDGGRLLNYVLNDRVAVQVKFSTQRLRPWQFTFASTHVHSLTQLSSRFDAVYVILVCWYDGFIALDAKEAIGAFQNSDSDTAWLRADRRKREMYRLYGPAGEFSGKLRTDLMAVVDQLR